MFRLRASVLTAVVSAALVAPSLAAQRPHYHVVKRMVLGNARADYIIVDPIGRRLYGLGDKVIDVDNDRSSIVFVDSTSS